MRNRRDSRRDGTFQPMSDLSAPLFGFDEPVPYQGRTVESRAASVSGAACVLEGRKDKTARYLALLKAWGALTDHRVAELTGWPLSSVNSIRGTLIEDAAVRELPAPIVPAGHQEIARGNRARKTVRTKWRLVGGV